MPEHESDDTVDRPDRDEPAELGSFVDAADSQSFADRDQTAADGDQTAADSDQTLADADQTNSDVEQQAADADQDASDRDLGHGVDPAAHEHSRDVRRRTTRLREQAAQERLKVAAQRDDVAHARDLAAFARDQAGMARDLAMAALDADHARDAGSGPVTGAEVVLRASEQRRRAAEYRARAAEYRALAAQDREAGCIDREQAARERLQALSDRRALAEQLALAETDALTGARTRAAGLRDLDHELERSRRTSAALVVAYVDVVGLKAVNDRDGHSAGDELLKRAVAAIRAHLRPYDLVIRLGGDEFLCAMTTMTIGDARARFGEVAAALATARATATIRYGFAELGPSDDSAALIARANRELLEARA